jgi:hypothetical protein
MPVIDSRQTWKSSPARERGVGPGRKEVEARASIVAAGAGDREVLLLIRLLERHPGQREPLCDAALGRANEVVSLLRLALRYQVVFGAEGRQLIYSLFSAGPEVAKARLEADLLSKHPFGSREGRALLRGIYNGWASDRGKVPTPEVTREILGHDREAVNRVWLLPAGFLDRVAEELRKSSEAAVQEGFMLLGSLLAHEQSNVSSGAMGADPGEYALSSVSGSQKL